MAAPFPDRQKAARSLLRSLYGSRQTLRTIHYACENLSSNLGGRSPRITSIAILNVESGQTTLFSIQQVAERRGIAHDSIAGQYDVIERQMLDEFYDYVRTQGTSRFLHWNMKGAGYGFEAIADRYRVLQGIPIAFNEDHLHNLANLTQAIYGSNYIQNPRMRKLAERNNITLRDFADGEREPEMFASGDYLGLRLSTLRKVEVIAEIGELAQRYKLKTDTSWFARNWGTLSGCVSWVADNKIFALITSLICVALGFVGAYLAYLALVVHGH